MNNFEKGIFYENLAKKIIISKKMEIIGERVKSKYGEIDILAKFKKDYYIVEIKYRKLLETALYSISKKQKTRTLETFFDYMNKNNLKIEQYFYIAIIFDEKKYKIVNIEI